MLAKFTIKDPKDGRAFDFELVAEEVRIGRTAGLNGIVLEDAQVSREHALVRRTRSNHVLIDLGSANGTYVNGQRIKEQVLKTGDAIKIGRFLFEYQCSDGVVSVKYEDEEVSSAFLTRKPDTVAAIAPQAAMTRLVRGQPDSKSLLEDMAVLRKKAETLARLYELNQMLGSVFSLDDIFKKLSEMLFRLSPADRFVVLLKDDQSGQLNLRTAEFRSARAPGEEIAISRTVVDRVVAERVSLLSFNTQSDIRLASSKSIIMQNIQSVMAAPLLGKDGLLGVIYVDCRERLKMFGEDDLDLLNALAAEASISVDNAITHNQLVRDELARAAYRRFMPPHVVDEILADPNAVNLGGKNSWVTTLFSDVRGFTTMAEGLPPEIVVQILNEYFAEMTPIVFEHRGLLDKYMGDGLMALYGVPYEAPDAAVDAVSAAIAMQRRMGALNEHLKASGLSEIAIGIGINTGMATVGYIGSQQRTDYTAIGDAINLAARLEKQAEAEQIIISHSTREAIGDRFPVKPVGEVRVKGKRESVRVYEVIWQDSPTAGTLRRRDTDPEVEQLID